MEIEAGQCSFMMTCRHDRPMASKKLILTNQEAGGGASSVDITLILHNKDGGV